jgi:hypothetical protein
MKRRKEARVEGSNETRRRSLPQNRSENEDCYTVVEFYNKIFF